MHVCIYIYIHMFVLPTCRPWSRRSRPCPSLRRPRGAPARGPQGAILITILQKECINYKRTKNINHHYCINNDMLLSYYDKKK